MYTLEGTVLIRRSRNFVRIVRMLILIKSQSDLKLGLIESKTRLLGQVIEKKNLVYILEGTVLIQISRISVRMLICIKSRSRFETGSY